MSTRARTHVRGRRTVMAELSDQLLVVAMLGYLVGDDLLRRRVRVRRPRARSPGSPSRELVGAHGRRRRWPAAAVDRSRSPSRPAAAPVAAPAGRAGAVAGRAAVVVTLVAVAAHGGSLVDPRRSPPAGCRGATCTSSSSRSASSARSPGSCVLAGRPALRQLGLFVALTLVVLLGVAGMVLYTPVGPLVPALNSYWLAIHVTAVAIAVGVFCSASCRRCCSCCATGYEQGKRGFPFALARRLPAADALERLDVPAARVRVPDLDLRASSAARSGPRRPGAGTGAGTRRRSGRSSPGWSTPATCTPGRRRASSGRRPPGSPCSAGDAC